MNNKKNYIYLDILRIINTLAILLYHLNILKGGYLAVCSFFVLSGYLTCINAFKKDKFSIISYYKNKLIKIYLPLLIVVLVTISVVSLFPDILWLNLKPETTSVILGYNNIWQLKSNIDYFIRNENSPFTHLWYISILIQFDLVFPLIYLLFKKIKEKLGKFIPCLISCALSLLSIICLYEYSKFLPIMTIYYGTLTRIFSLIFGLTLGLIQHYYKTITFKKKTINKIILAIYTFTLIILYFIVDAKSNYFLISLVVVSFITCRIIDYGILINKNNKIIKNITSLSYGIYLFQYPVIYIFKYININQFVKIFLIIVLTSVLSYLLKICLLKINKKDKNKILKYILKIIVLLLSLFGIYKYIIAEDHTEEMNKLKEQLEHNQMIIELKQDEYAKKLKEEQEQWNLLLKDLNNPEEKVKEMVLSLPIIGIGDSIMLGAVETMSNTFKNSYFDAKVSRSAWSADGIINDLKNKNMLGNPVIFNLGANGDCNESCKDIIMNDLGDRKVFWMTVTNDKDVNFNNKIKRFAQKYNNLHIIDWESISNGHSEYFFSDGLHLTTSGRIAYTNAIYNSLYNIYLEEYNMEKETILKQHEEIEKNKITFYGNDILLNIHDDLGINYADAKLSINKEYDFDTLIKDINNSINNNSLTYKVVLAFDSNLILNTKQYNEIINLCKNNIIYIISTNRSTNSIIKNFKADNVIFINFYNKVKDIKDYYLADRIHLSDKGNILLYNTIIEYIK